MVKKRIIVSVISDLCTDQRVHKVCTYLVSNGYEVFLIGRKAPASQPVENRAYKTHRIKLIFNKGPLYFAEFNIRLFLHLLFRKSDLLLSNDLDTLLPNYLVSKLRKSELVYDSHEYFTHVPELVTRPRTQKIWLGIERFLFPKLTKVYTVNDSISKIYFEKYKIRPLVLRNISPKYKGAKGKRKDLGLPEDKSIVILQGAGINIDRGAEELIDAMPMVNSAVLLIAGSGDVIDQLKDRVEELQLQEKVIFRSKMPYDQLMLHTTCCDLGVSLDKNTNPNYLYSLPNKIFDYIHAGIPVLASDLVEVGKLIREHKFGLLINSHDPRQIAEKINQLFADKSLYHNLKENAITAANQLNWESESKVLGQVY